MNKKKLNDLEKALYQVYDYKKCPMQCDGVKCVYGLVNNKCPRTLLKQVDPRYLETPIRMMLSKELDKLGI